MQYDTLADKDIKEVKEREKLIEEAAIVLAEKKAIRDNLSLYENHFIKSFLRHLKRRTDLGTMEFLIFSLLTIMCLFMLIYAKHGMANIFYTAFIMTYAVVITIIVVELRIRAQELAIAIEMKNLEFMDLLEKLVDLNVKLGYSFAETRKVIEEYSQKVRNPLSM